MVSMFLSIYARDKRSNNDIHSIFRLQSIFKGQLLLKITLYDDFEYCQSLMQTMHPCY